MGRRILIMRRDFFLDMLREGERHYIIKQGLPADAALIAISVHEQFYCDALALKFESAAWPDLEPGQKIPEIDITITTIDSDKDLVRLPKFREFT